MTDFFEFHQWANATLIDVCEGLNDATLDAEERARIRHDPRGADASLRDAERFKPKIYFSIGGK